MKKEVTLEEICNIHVQNKITERKWSGWWERENVYEVMKEACRQVLELASENATVIKKSKLGENGIWKTEYVIIKDSITNTINQVK